MNIIKQIQAVKEGRRQKGREWLHGLISSREYYHIPTYHVMQFNEDGTFWRQIYDASNLDPDKLVPGIFPDEKYLIYESFKTQKDIEEDKRYFNLLMDNTLLSLKDLLTNKESITVTHMNRNYLKYINIDVVTIAHSLNRKITNKC